MAKRDTLRIVRVSCTVVFMIILAASPCSARPCGDIPTAPGKPGR